VVATRCGGPEDIVVPAVGELVPVGDARALADALTSVLSGTRTFSPAALRAHAVARFSWDRAVEGIRAVYAQAIAE
jgi:glycosyltransferase involved in cell wall biosynthesis